MVQYDKAIALHAEHKEIVDEMGNRAWVGRACGNLESSSSSSIYWHSCYYGMGQYGKAMQGDRAGVMRACSFLCNCHAQESMFDQAVSYCISVMESPENCSSQTKNSENCSSQTLADEGLDSALDIDTVLRLALSSDRRGHAAEASLGQAAPHTSRLIRGRRRRLLITSRATSHTVLTLDVACAGVASKCGARTHKCWHVAAGQIILVVTLAAPCPRLSTNAADLRLIGARIGARKAVA
jgi:hypothetical protein